MKKGKLFLAVAMSLCLTACAGNTAKALEASSSPEAAMESTMEALKALDLEAFNDYTDNYVATHRNDLGIPVRREYRVFNELMQPGIQGGKKYKWNKELAEKIVENLSWEIKEVREKGDEAQIDLILFNKDLTDVTGIYELNLIKDMVESEGTGMMYLVREMYGLANDGGDLCAIIEEMDQTRSFEVTVQMKRENGKWVIHLSEDLIDAFMGNLGGSLSDGKYSEEIEKQLESLDQEMDDKMDQVGEEIEKQFESLDLEGLFFW